MEADHVQTSLLAGLVPGGNNSTRPGVRGLAASRVARPGGRRGTLPIAPPPGCLAVVIRVKGSTAGKVPHHCTFIRGKGTAPDTRRVSVEAGAIPAEIPQRSVSRYAHYPKPTGAKAVGPSSLSPSVFAPKTGTPAERTLLSAATASRPRRLCTSGAANRRTNRIPGTKGGGAALAAATRSAGAAPATAARRAPQRRRLSWWRTSAPPR